MQERVSLESLGAPDWPQRLWRGLALVAALLLGAGLIFAVAAQWPEQSRGVKLHVLEAALAAPVLLAGWAPRWRLPGLLLATLALGGLLAFVGQTYQTGADAWQLFATWAALSVLWVLLARSDGLWALWWSIAAAGLALWLGRAGLGAEPLLFAHGRWQLLDVLPWLGLWLGPRCLPYLPLCAVAQPRLSRVLGAALALAAWTGYGLWSLAAPAQPVPGLWWTVWALLAALLWLAWRQREVLVLALGLLAANVLWLAFLGRWLSPRMGHDGVGSWLLLVGLTALSVGASTQWLYRQQRRWGEAVALPDGAQPASAPAIAPAIAPALAFDQQPSWVVVVLGFFGAQLSLWPLVVTLALLSWDWLLQAPGAWLAALALAVLAAFLLRQQQRLFVQQLGLNVALLAQVLWLVGWRGDVGWWPLLGLLGLQAGMAWASQTPWVQRLLGCLASAVLLALPSGLSQSVWGEGGLWDAWPRHAQWLALCWLLWLWGLRGSGLRGSETVARWCARVLPWMEGAAVGLLLALALRSAALAALLGAQAQGSADVAGAGSQAWWDWGWTQSAQLAWLLLGAGWLCWQWRPRGRAAALLALVYGALALACAVVPQLGVLALLGSTAAASGRWRLLWLCLALLLLGLGNFYYALAWPLVDKAWLLAALGLGLGLALWGLRWRSVRAPAAVAAGRWQALAVLLGLVLALGLVHQDVQRKERVLAQGQKIYVPLAPRDPRSLLQGDYMALNFALPASVSAALEVQLAQQPWSRRALVLAQLDGRGVAQLLRLGEVGQVLAPGQVLLPLQRLKGRWVVVTDAFFFPEGQGQPLAQARFGELRVLGPGQALLAGLADERLQAIAPAPSLK